MTLWIGEFGGIFGPQTGGSGTPVVRAFPIAYNSTGISTPAGGTQAFVLADTAPTLPLTILLATNDTFVFTGGGGGGSPETFTIAPGVYTTITALAAAVAAATGSVSSEAFSTHVTVTHPSTKLLFTMVGDSGAADNGNKLTEGDGGAAAIGITSPPDTFASGVTGTIPGLAVYTPNVGDILTDAWVEVDTAWNGTTPTGDVGTFAAKTSGFYAAGHALLDMTKADTSTDAPGVLNNDFSLSVQGSGIVSDKRLLPGKITVANPIKIVVSQNGASTGGDPHSTQGSGVLYLITVTPH